LIDWILEHRRRAPNHCPVDFNEDGIVNDTELSLLLGVWGTTSSVYDLDGDGGGDGDLSLVLADWGKYSI
jgi:hypothetical protein